MTVHQLARIVVTLATSADLGLITWLLTGAAKANAERRWES